MPSPRSEVDVPTLTWAILTMGDRPDALSAAIASVREHCDPTSRLLVVSNGGPPEIEGVGPAELVVLPENVGVPAGRDIAARHAATDVVGFLDDDARLTRGAEAHVAEAFAGAADVAAVAMRLVDELGETARRHVPRVGNRGVTRRGPTVNFLGGACAVRRSAYLAVGGYWHDLWYGHEELDLAWRLLDAGWSVVYEPAAVVEHPRTDIARHETGWYRTGRNRVLVARRNLPVPVLIAHTVLWLVAGAWRAPRGTRRSYLRGWSSGWSAPVDRRPISWRTVWQLARLGRPPVV